MSPKNPYQELVEYHEALQSKRQAANTFSATEGENFVKEIIGDFFSHLGWPKGQRQVAKLGEQKKSIIFEDDKWKCEIILLMPDETKIRVPFAVEAGNEKTWKVNCLGVESNLSLQSRHLFAEFFDKIVEMIKKQLDGLQ